MRHAQTHRQVHKYPPGTKAILPQQYRLKLAHILDSYLRERLTQMPELQETHRQLELAAAGQTFTMNKWWSMRGPSDTPCLAEKWASEPYGGCTNTVHHRWLEGFTTKKARQLLRNQRGECHTPVAYHLTQEQVGRPRPAYISNDEQLNSYLEAITEAIQNNSEVPLKQGEHHEHELIVNYVINKVEGKKDRYCRNGKPSKGSVKELMEKRHTGTGSRQINDIHSQQDLVMGFDQRAAYHQHLQTYPSSMRELQLIRQEHLVMVYNRLGLTMPTNLRKYTHQGTTCYLLRPKTLQFGNARSAELFLDRYGLILSELRQRARMRIPNQADDVVIMCKHGPAATLCEGAIFIATMAWYNNIVHLTKKVTDWPMAVIEFDGTEVYPGLSTRFLPEKTHDRHTRDLQTVIDAYNSNKPVTLTALQSVAMQQQYDYHSHWPSALYLPELKAHLSMAQAEIRETHRNPDTIWSARTKAPSHSCRYNMQQLTLPRDQGEAMRPTGPSLGVLTADSSCFGTGLQLTLYHPNGDEQSVRHRFYLTKAEREKWHTHQEAIGIAQAVVAVIHHHNIQTWKQYQVLVVNTDNKATVAAGNKPSKTLSMANPMRAAKQTARERGILLKFQYLPKASMDRTYADFDGRRRNHNQQWGLQPQMFHRALKALNIHLTLQQQTEAFDLAACRNTTQFQRYISRYAEPEASAIDTLTAPWPTGVWKYIYPPLAIVPQVLHRIQTQHEPVIMVVPMTLKSPPWWPLFAQMAGDCVIIPSTPDLHYPPEGHEVQGQATTEKASPTTWPLIFSKLTPPTTSSTLRTDSDTGQGPPLKRARLQPHTCSSRTKMVTVIEPWGTPGPNSPTKLDLKLLAHRLLSQPSFYST